MPCYYPITAWQDVHGGVTFVERGDIQRTLTLPCGQCIGCRLEKARQWALRCTHEAQMHEHNSFVTLTYENAPLSLNHRHFQLFMKRLRKANPDTPIRYYMAGEYGAKLQRPHYHACLFGIWFPDQLQFSKRGDNILYTSKQLEQLWGLGFCTVAEVNSQTAGYVARYATKKITGDLADAHYRKPDPETGELVKIEPEYNRMSLKPGIGATWIEKYERDVYPRGEVLSNGHWGTAPRYYDKLQKERNSAEFENITQLRRETNARKNAHDNTDERLKVKEQVAQARLNLRKRSIEQ